MQYIKLLFKYAADQVTGAIKEEIALLASTEINNLLIPIVIGVMT